MREGGFRITGSSSSFSSSASGAFKKATRMSNTMPDQFSSEPLLRAYLTDKMSAPEAYTSSLPSFSIWLPQATMRNLRLCPGFFVRNGFMGITTSECPYFLLKASNSSSESLTKAFLSTKSCFSSFSIASFHFSLSFNNSWTLTMRVLKTSSSSAKAMACFNFQSPSKVMFIERRSSFSMITPSDSITAWSLRRCSNLSWTSSSTRRSHWFMFSSEQTKTLLLLRAILPRILLLTSKASTSRSRSSRT